MTPQGNPPSDTAPTVPPAPVVPVVVIGAGPTGLTAATLLGQYGITCVVLDRWAAVHPLPRAVHLDDETYRLLARLGVGEQFGAISRPARGLRLLDRELRVLAEFRRGAERGRHGYPEANMFDQPQLEEILRANLGRHPTVRLRGGTEVTALDQSGPGPVRLSLTDRATGRTSTMRAAYVLGCDGANSFVRASIGAVMRNLGGAQRWLVVDVATDAPLGQWEGVHQVCDPVRAATYMRIGERRYRWEFRLRPGESADDFRTPDRLYPLLRPWTGSVPPHRLEILRTADYVFRAQTADRWRDRRVFLLGDAAHLSPPFIGQGMGAGLRDAANLAWKLKGVLADGLPHALLDTYEAERRPHARALILRAHLVGVAMTAGAGLGDRLRGTVAPRLHQWPGATERVLSSATPPLRRSPLVRRPPLGRGLGGRLCPNALLADGRRFDEAVRGRFALVTTGPAAPGMAAEAARRGIVCVSAAASADLRRWLREGHARAALVRPDGTVLRAARSPERLLADLRRLAPPDA
jgi:3-(3-hydroxy-phenyl)propionate hydroxylase